MKVDDFNKNVEGGLASVSATVTWEDADRPERRIYIKTDAQFADDLDCNPNAFLLAAVIPAMQHGERRVLVEGKVCPQLRNGLVTAMQILRRWYGEAKHCPVKIEATDGFEPPLPRSPQRTASFLSGGVDALATLRSNRLDFPLDHPGSIQDCFFVHGVDVGGYEALHHNRENSEFAIASLREFAGRAKATLIPVYTNIRHLDDDDAFFFKEFYGVLLAAVAHAFSRRITTAMIAAGSSVLDLNPIGSHPLLDPNYSGFDVQIQHDGIRFSRLEKVGLISEWDDALQTLRSCFDPFRSGKALNCGRCEKCLRTMTGLLVYDKLKRCPTYPLDDVSPEMLQTITAEPLRALKRKRGSEGTGERGSEQARERALQLRTPMYGRRAFRPYELRTAVVPADSPVSRKLAIGVACVSLGPANVYYWRELIDPLVKIGRRDLVNVIEAKLAAYEKYQARMKRKGAARRFDQKYLGGVLSKLNRLARGKPGVLKLYV